MKSLDKNLRNELIQFLNDNGWQRKLSKDERTIRFTKEGSGLDRAVHIFISKTPDDSSQLNDELAEALRVIRQFYGVSFYDLRDKSRVLSRTTAPDSGDTIFGRIPDAWVRNESVDLTLATSVLGFLQRLLSETANLEALQEGRSERISSTIAKEFLSSCRFGHTFRGSFGFSVECPVDPDAQLSLDIFDVREPLGRSVALRVNQSMEIVDQALHREDPSLLVAGSNALSLGMCNILADFLEETELSHFHLDVHFGQYRGQVSVSERGAHRLEYKSVPILREAAKRLTPELDVSVRDLIGIVIGLRSTNFPVSPEKDGLGRVTIRVPSELGSLDVNVSLEGIHYVDAIRAHELGQFVRLVAEVEHRPPNRINVLRVESFGLI